MKRLLLVPAVALLALGCDEEKSGNTASTASAAKAAASATVEAPEPTPPPKPSAEGPTFEDGVFVGLPKEKSDAPSDAEWKDAKAISNVPGNAGPTGCPVKRIREWAQVNCFPFGGNNPTKPKWKAEKIDIVKGKGPDVKSTVKGGVATLTFPMREGSAVDAMIEYSSGGPKKVVSMAWDKDAVGPSLKTRTGM